MGSIPEKQRLTLRRPARGQTDRTTDIQGHGSEDGEETIVNMEAVFEYPIRIHPYDADGGGRMKVSSAFNYIQNLASMHSDGLGFGFQDVGSRGMFWVLSWASLEFDALPALGDEIRGRTWPKREYKLFSIRDFLFFDSKGEVFCRAGTGWMLIDMNTKKATSIRCLKSSIPYVESESALARLPERLNPPESCREVYTRRIRYSDLDVNRHVNNARHTEFLMDCYDIEHHRSWRVRSLTVSFVAEARFGDEISFRLSDGRPDGSTHFIESRRVESDTPVVQAAIGWTPR